MTDAPTGVVAQVVAVQCFPVRGADSGPVRAIHVSAAGVVGDRTHVVLDGAGERVTAARAPALAEVCARLDGERLEIEVPGHGRHLAGPGADAALSALLGFPARLAAAGTAHAPVAQVHLLSRLPDGAVRDCRAGHGDSCPCATAHPRANLLLGPPGRGNAPGERGEEGWTGVLLRVGTAVLRVTGPPEHCRGVYAAVVSPGQIQAGDRVVVAPRAARPPVAG